MAIALAGGDRRVEGGHLRGVRRRRCRRFDWQRDYVELYNPTDQAVDLAGTSVQYRSASGSANPSGVTALSGSIPAKGYFLVGEGTGTTGAPVPSPGVSGSIQLSGTAGTVFLANQARP